MGSGQCSWILGCKILEKANYDVTLHFIEHVKEPGTIRLKLYPQNFVQHNLIEADGLSLKNIELRQGEFKLEAFYRTNKGRHIFPLYVSLKRLE